MILKPSSAKSIRLVLDTNVYLASINPQSHLSKFIFSRHDGTNPHQIYISSFILVEIESKLCDTNKFGLDKRQVVAYLKSVLGVTKLIYPSFSVNIVKNDPDDNKILECALEAKADMLISADKDLLRLKNYKNTTIAHPSQLKYIFPDNF